MPLVTTVVALIVITDRFLLPADLTALPLLVGVPALAGSGGRDPRRIVHVGALTLVAVVVGAIGRPAGAAVAGGCLIAIIGTTTFAWRSARLLRGQERALGDARAIAETVQRVLLRPIPRRVGGLRAEVRYLAAAAEARVGGDVYDIVSTPFGVRLLIGDVMGKGLAAVETAADLLGAFRELAQHEEKLSGVAERMDAVLAHRGDGEKFATAILVTIKEDERCYEVICCGHPAPLLLRGPRVTFLDALSPAPPLGLLEFADHWVETSVLPFRQGDRLLLYTDGVTEARDRTGRFYPLPDHVAALRREDPCALLDALGASLERHVGGRLQDDAALLLIQYNPGGSAMRDGACLNRCEPT